MFKSILPSNSSSKRFTSGTYQADTSGVGKENHAPGTQRPRSNTQGHAKAKSVSAALQSAQLSGTEPELCMEFDKLLDDLQIPDHIRPRLATMDGIVKAEMVRSSRQVTTLKRSASPPRTPSRILTRRNSFDSPGASTLIFDDAEVLEPPRPSFVDETRMSKRRSIEGLPRSNSALSLLLPDKEKDKSKLAKPGLKESSALKYTALLAGTSSTIIDIESVKKLRLMLRNEPASWTQEFLHQSGYEALLTRINELLEVEWREEQHDDKALHELLRCLKALSTSSVGCHAIRNGCPRPFSQLLSLLFSDKKPGDVATRQLIVELILILFDLYPSTSVPGSSFGRPGARSTALSLSSICLPATYNSTFEFVRALLLTKPPAPVEAPSSASIAHHDFIETLHTPRLYKAYLRELSDVCRDYFWVFCHPQNSIWSLNATDERKVEKPRAPGGMTGGVEFEAMCYMTLHFKLINTLARTVLELNHAPADTLGAHRFHSDLFSSGLERIILIARKASTTYYPTLHLEIGRYISSAAEAKFEVPWTVARLIGPPPAAMCKPGFAPPPSASTTPSKRARGTSRPPVPGAPLLPEPKKLDAIQL